MCLISDPGTLGAGAKTRLHTPKAVTHHVQPHYCIQNKEIYATLHLHCIVFHCIFRLGSFRKPTYN